MGRTDWGMVIIGGGALLGIAYVFFNWKTICPQVLSAEQCTGGQGLFGGTLIGSGNAQGYGQILTKTNPTTGKTSSQVINPSNTITGASNRITAGATLGKPVKKLNATGSVGAAAGVSGRRSNYTDFHSFNTITLNKLSVR
jgi:hypothetical protein